MSRNVPSVLIALPHVRPLADLELAYNARRVKLATLADVELIAARQLFAEVEAELVPQPTMARLDGTGYRSMPRDGRGRLLSKAWLQSAETELTSDVAWFRSPIRCTEGK